MKVIQVALLVVLSVTLAYCSYHQEHIARTHDPKSMVVSWFTKRPVPNAHVKYYRVANKAVTTPAESATFNATVGYVHHAVIQSLFPDTLYSYTVTVANNTYGDVHTFRTSNTSFTAPFKIPLYGDMGISNSLNTMNQVTKLISADHLNQSAEHIPFILHVGDISYADDRNSILYEHVWDTWFNMMSKVLTTTPYMVMPGNHEHESGRPFLPYSQYFVDFNYRFKMPLAGPLSDPYYHKPHNMWWSFDHQNVHIIALSTETDYSHSPYDPNFGDQVAWLHEDLIKAAANRHNVPWIIAMGHRPLYTSAKGGYFQNAQYPLRDAIEDLFHQYGVDIYFSGHVHAYERTWPVYKNVTEKTYDNPKGLTTITAGGAGCTEGLLTDWVEPRAEWSAKIFDQDETYGLIHIESNSVLKWELFSAKHNAVVDHITLTRHH
eukprot:TRINITY_DN193_c0_g1_i1.p1 TRINITY_DN193_c0_g1~~TRINITY_DN193_c0_g1_i1.p1  ORF type:complete len:434 (-),score=64.78 TRINITY_DN193_c0_g1_i1:195-1496(-)